MQHKSSINSSIDIEELVKNPKNYEGKTDQLTGICSKTNAGSIDRNWIYIKGRSKDDLVLIITTDDFVFEGIEFTIKALEVFNKDFVAGYKYDLIL